MVCDGVTIEGTSREICPLVCMYVGSCYRVVLIWSRVLSSKHPKCFLPFSFLIQIFEIPFFM